MVPLKFRKQVLMQILKKTVQPAKLSAVVIAKLRDAIINYQKETKKTKRKK